LEQLWNPASLLFKGNEKSLLQSGKGANIEHKLCLAPSWHDAWIMETTFATRDRN